MLLFWAFRLPYCIMVGVGLFATSTAQCFAAKASPGFSLQSLTQNITYRLMIVLVQVVNDAFIKY